MLSSQCPWQLCTIKLRFISHTEKLWEKKVKWDDEEKKMVFWTFYSQSEKGKFFISMTHSRREVKDAAMTNLSIFLSHDWAFYWTLLPTAVLFSLNLQFNFQVWRLNFTPVLTNRLPPFTFTIYNIKSIIWQLKVFILCDHHEVCGCLTIQYSFPTPWSGKILTSSLNLIMLIYFFYFILFLKSV